MSQAAMVKSCFAIDIFFAIDILKQCHFPVLGSSVVMATRFPRFHG